MIQRLRPLGLACLALLVGLLPALRFAPHPALPLLGAAALAGAMLLLARRGALPPSRVLAALLLGVSLAGAALGAVEARRLARDCRLRLPDGARVVARGRLGANLRAPREGEPPPLLPLEAAVVAREGGASCRGAIRVRFPDATRPALAGSRVAVEGEWIAAGAPLLRSRWPAEPLFAGRVAGGRVLFLRAAGFAEAPLLWLRGRAEDRLWALFGSRGGLASALLLGRREWLDRDLRDRFARAGLVHLLAISGSHVGLFAAMVLIVGAAARVPRRRLWWGCMAAVAAYLAVIGAPASAVRAGIMVSLALVARLLQRPSATAPLVAATALPILALRPAAALDPGVQLSFAGVLGILLLHPRLLQRCPAGWRRTAAGRWTAESLSLSIAAFAATAPIAAYHFGQLAPVSIPANLLAVPLTSLALCGVVAALSLDVLAPPVARLVADGAQAVLLALDRTAQAAAALPGGHFGVPRPDVAAWAAAALAAAATLALVPALRPRVRTSLALGTAAALLLAWPALARGGAGELQIHFIDVGQGDAVALRTPTGRWLLVDAGPRGRGYDAGERRVLPFLRAHGATRLEALILTHPDADHIGGAAAVLRGMPVGRVVEPGLPVGKEMYVELLREIERRGIPWSAARAGRSLALDGVRLELLWPHAETLDGAAEANQISAVVMVRYGAFSLLLTGDVAEEVESELVRRAGGALPAQVLKAGHHGSATSTSGALLAAVRPEMVVISAGRRNRYGHPAPEVLERLAVIGTRIARTDREGSVTLRVADGGRRWAREER